MGKVLYCTAVPCLFAILYISIRYSRLLLWWREYWEIGGRAKSGTGAIYTILYATLNRHRFTSSNSWNGDFTYDALIAVLSILCNVLRSSDRLKIKAYKCTYVRQTTTRWLNVNENMFVSLITTEREYHQMYMHKC